MDVEVKLVHTVKSVAHNDLAGVGIGGAFRDRIEGVPKDVRQGRSCWILLRAVLSPLRGRCGNDEWSGRNYGAAGFLPKALICGRTSGRVDLEVDYRN